LDFIIDRILDPVSTSSKTPENVLFGTKTKSYSLMFGVFGVTISVFILVLAWCIGRFGVNFAGNDSIQSLL